MLVGLAKWYAVAFPLTTRLDYIHCEAGLIYTSVVLNTDNHISLKTSDRLNSSFRFSIASRISRAAGNMCKLVIYGKLVEKCR